MAIQVSGTQVIGNSRELTNITSVDTTTKNSIIAAGVGDIQGVTAGTGLSGGGTSGTVTLNGTTHSQATWEAGTSTTEAVVSPAKVKAAIDALAGGGFSYAAVSGATQALDVGAYNFFDAGTLTADTTISFTNVPTEAQWTYTFFTSPTNSYDLTAAATNASSSLTLLDTASSDLVFKTDGTKVFVVGDGYNKVYELSLSKAWDISTAVYSTEYNITTSSSPYGLAFKPDGTKMYIQDFFGLVYQYTLSTAWSVSTASYDSVSFSVAAQFSNVNSIEFSADGLKMYSVANNATVYQYTLSTAWALNTASYSGISKSVSAQESGLTGMCFNSTGTEMYIVGTTGDDVTQYNLSTAWNVSTATPSGTTFYIGNGSDPKAIFISPDGVILCVIALYSSALSIIEYTIADITTVTVPISVQNPPLAEPSVNSQVAYTFFTANAGTTVKLINEQVL